METLNQIYLSAYSILNLENYEVSLIDGEMIDISKRHEVIGETIDLYCFIFNPKYKFFQTVFGTENVEYSGLNIICKKYQKNILDMIINMSYSLGEPDYISWLNNNTNRIIKI